MIMFIAIVICVAICLTLVGNRLFADRVEPYNPDDYRRWKDDQ